MRRAYTNNIHTIAGMFGIEAAAVAIIKVSLYLVMLCFKVSWLVIVVYCDIADVYASLSQCGIGILPE